MKMRETTTEYYPDNYFSEYDRSYIFRTTPLGSYNPVSESEQLLVYEFLNQTKHDECCPTLYSIMTATGVTEINVRLVIIGMYIQDYNNLNCRLERKAHNLSRCISHSTELTEDERQWEIRLNELAAIARHQFESQTSLVADPTLKPEPCEVTEDDQESSVATDCSIRSISFFENSNIATYEAISEDDQIEIHKRFKQFFVTYRLLAAKNLVPYIDDGRNAEKLNTIVNIVFLQMLLQDHCSLNKPRGAYNGYFRSLFSDTYYRSSVAFEYCRILNRLCNEAKHSLR